MKTTLHILLSAFVISAASAGEAWTIDSQEEWQAVTASQSNLEIKDGMATPMAETASFQSKLKTFEMKQSAKSLLIR